MARRATLLAFLAALAYFLAFHRYGFYAQDEGVIAYQALRVAQGQLPYRDFQTAYPPATFYLHALLFRLGGPSFSLLRVAGACACALTAALLLLAARDLLPFPWALLPSLLYVLLEDQESGGFVVHTISYPSRYVTALWALSLCLTLAHARRPRRWLPVVLGLVAAAIAAFKHTAGLYNAWAVGLCLILIGRGEISHGETAAAAPPPPERRVAVALPLVFLVLLLAAVPALFAGFARRSPAALAVFALPLTMAAALLVPGAWPRRSCGAAERAALATSGSDLFLFAAAAVLPTALWVAYFGSRAGWGVLVQRLLLEGPAAARSFGVAMPPPGPLASGALVLVTVAAAARMLSRRRYLETRTAAWTIGLVAGGLALAAGVGAARLVPEVSAVRLLLAANHVGRSVDNLAFYLVPVIACAFLARLGHCLRSGKALDRVFPCWVHALCQLLVAYPRLDVAHLYEGTPIMLIAGTVLLRRLLAFCGATAPRCGRWLAAGTACAVLVLGAVKLTARIDAQVTWERGLRLRPRTALVGPRGGLYATDARGDAEWLATLNRAVALIGARTAPGTPIFTYPALAAVYFLSGRPNPTVMDYFHRGFGEGRDEVAVMNALERAQVPLALVMSDESFDPQGRNYFPMLKDYLRRNFVQTDSLAPLQVLQRVVR